MVLLDESQFGTANATAETKGDDDAADFNHKDEECYYACHYCCYAVVRQKGLNGRDAST